MHPSRRIVCRRQAPSQQTDSTSKGFLEPVESEVLEHRREVADDRFKSATLRAHGLVHESKVRSHRFAQPPQDGEVAV